MSVCVCCCVDRLKLTCSVTRFDWSIEQSCMNAVSQSVWCVWSHHTLYVNTSCEQVTSCWNSAQSLHDVISCLWYDHSLCNSFFSIWNYFRVSLFLQACDDLSKWTVLLGSSLVCGPHIENISFIIEATGHKVGCQSSNTSNKKVCTSPQHLRYHSLSEQSM